MTPDKPVSHEEARGIAQRFIDEFFDNKGTERPRISIPARPDHDDDVRLHSYISQRESAERELTEKLRAAEAALDDEKRLRRLDIESMADAESRLLAATKELEREHQAFGVAIQEGMRAQEQARQEGHERGRAEVSTVCTCERSELGVYHHRSLCPVHRNEAT